MVSLYKCRRCSNEEKIPTHQYLIIRYVNTNGEIESRWDLCGNCWQTARRTITKYTSQEYKTEKNPAGTIKDGLDFRVHKINTRALSSLVKILFAASNEEVEKILGKK